MHKLNKRVIFAPANKKNNRRAVARHKNKKYESKYKNRSYCSSKPRRVHSLCKDIVKTEYEARAIAEREEQKAFFCLHEMKEYRL